MLTRIANRLLTVAALVIPVACSAQPEAYVEGEHYKQVRNIEQSEGDSVRVTEVFWYGCPHCYRFEPHVREWKASAPDYVEFERLPTALGREAGRLQVKAFYAAGALDVQDEVHAAIFDAIHNKRRQLASEDALADIFEASGVSREDFKKAFNGFTVESRTRQAERRVSDFGISSVPTVIVDGRWQVGAGGAGSFEEMLAIVDFLVAKARSER
jgi:thiol:disulfide interchange protein DsbA